MQIKNETKLWGSPAKPRHTRCIREHDAWGGLVYNGHINKSQFEWNCNIYFLFLCIVRWGFRAKQDYKEKLNYLIQWKMQTRAKQNYKVKGNE